MESPIIDHPVACTVVLGGRDDQTLIAKQVSDAIWGGAREYCYVYAEALDPVYYIVYFGEFCLVSMTIPYVSICGAQVVWE